MKKIAQKLKPAVMKKPKKGSSIYAKLDAAFTQMTKKNG